MMHSVTCKRCGKQQDVPKEEHKQPDMPVGWSTVTVAQRGTVVVNLRLCEWCTNIIQKEMNQ